MNPDQLQAACSVVQTVALVVGGYLSLVQLRGAVSDKRAEWMWKLHQDFLTDGQNPAFRQIRDVLEQPGEFDLRGLDAIDDFLSFLETVAVLSDTGQLPRKYAHALFGYWIERLQKKGATSYLREYHYTHLLAWVENRPMRVPTLHLPRVGTPHDIPHGGP